MACAFVLNANDTYSPMDTARSRNNSGPIAFEGLQRMRFYVNDVITPVVFLFGMIGNVISFVVLSNRRLYPGRRQTMLERSAIFGLKILALSDFSFCAFGLPAPFLRNHPGMPSDGPWVILGAYYLAHKGAFLNLFLFTSTWLIVLISVERYLVVCHPFRSASMIHIRKTVVAYVTVLVVSLLVNLPLFLKFSIHREPCNAGCVCYYPQPSFFFATPLFVQTHKIVWFTVGTFLPLLLILTSNGFLVRELLRSHKAAAKEKRPSDPTSDESLTLRLTVTLTAIVVCFFVLVCPSIVLQFIRFEDYYDVISGVQSHLKSGNGYTKVCFQMALSITNLTQALKFSSNFLLYCAINKTFRQTLRGLMRGDCCRREQAPTNYEMGAMV